MADLSGQLFGAPVGQAIGQELDRQYVETLSKIALDKAHSRLFNADASLKEQEALDQQWLQNAILEMGKATAGSDISLDPVSASLSLGKAITDMSMLAFNSGRPAIAAKYGKIASEIDSNARLADLRLARKNEVEQKQAYETLDRIGGVMASIKDQGTYDQARLVTRSNPQWGINLDRLPPKYEDAAPTIGSVAQMSMKAKDQLDLKNKADELQRKKDADAERARFYENWAGFRDREVTVRENAEARREKYGGKPVGTPSKTGINMAAAAVQSYAKEQGVSVSSEDLATISEAVASRAAAIMKGTPGIDLNEATLRAMQEARKADDFSVAEGMLTALPGWVPRPVRNLGSKLKFEGRGNTSRAPLPVPSSAQGLVKGKWYELPQGIGQFNGTDFDLAEDVGDSESED